MFTHDYFEGVTECKKVSQKIVGFHGLPVLTGIKMFW